jgi:hypothetical protein
MDKKQFDKLKIYEKWDFIYNELITKEKQDPEIIKRLNKLEDDLNRIIKEINNAFNFRGFK